MSSNATLWNRWRDAWRDRRLAALPDREFCRRVSLEGWSAIAEAAQAGTSLRIAVGGSLPRTAARALRLFAAGLACELAGDAADVEAQGERKGRGARVTIRRPLA
jgi:hypothetical protein